jgi:hypothetical protein
MQSARLEYAEACSPGGNKRGRSLESGKHFKSVLQHEELKLTESFIKQEDVGHNSTHL